MSNTINTNYICAGSISLSVEVAQLLRSILVLHSISLPLCLHVISCANAEVTTIHVHVYTCTRIDNKSMQLYVLNELLNATFSIHTST